MNNDLAKPVLVSILAVFIAAITLPRNVVADEADAETAAKEGSEAIIEENIIDRTVSNDPNEEALAPKDKGGPSTRALGCSLKFDNYTPWKIQMFVNGVYTGLLPKYGNTGARGAENLSSFVLFGLAEFTNGTKKTWGPETVKCRGTFTWRLTQ